MFGRSKKQRIKENVLSVSELAQQLAQDKKFRKRLLSGIKHSSEARRRARSGGLTGAIGRLAADQSLQAELRSAREDLQRAYGRVEAKRRSHRLRRFTLLAGIASLAAVPQIRQRLASLIAKVPKGREQLTGVTNRVRSKNLRAPSRPQTLEDLTKEELYARAQEADIPGRSEMSKEQLVQALRARS